LAIQVNLVSMLAAGSTVSQVGLPPQLLLLVHGDPMAHPVVLLVVLPAVLPSVLPVVLLVVLLVVRPSVLHDLVVLLLAVRLLRVLVSTARVATGFLMLRIQNSLHSCPVA
jgi:hypothetical protein